MGEVVTLFETKAPSPPRDDAWTLHALAAASVYLRAIAATGRGELAYAADQADKARSCLDEAERRERTP